MKSSKIEQHFRKQNVLRIGYYYSLKKKKQQQIFDFERFLPISTTMSIDKIQKFPLIIWIFGKKNIISNPSLRNLSTHIAIDQIRQIFLIS